MKKLLYTSAFDHNGHIVNADDAEKGGVFTCVECSTNLVLKKSGKSGKGTKRPHFAHSTLASDCTPESVLHFTFKTLLAEKLSEDIRLSNQVKFKWHCETCNGTHAGNLLKQAKKIEVEHSLAECRPDILIIDKNDKAHVAIEIVVTHKPEEKAIKFYKENHISMIQIDLKSDEDIYRIPEKLTNPTRVSTCLNPKCLKCGKHKQEKKLITYKTRCDCGELNVIAYITKLDDDDEKVYCGIWEMNKSEIEQAKIAGANIQWAKSKNDKWFLVNKCASCNEQLNQQHLNCFWASPFPPVDITKVSEYDYYSSPEVTSLKFTRIGFYCIYCNKKATYDTK